GVEEPPGRLDLGGHVGAERALGVGEAAAEVDHEDRGARPERDALAEPRRRVDLACFLVAQAVTFSAEPSTSPTRARLTNCPAPGSPTSSSFSTITWPRTSTACGAPVTLVPSNRL